MLFSTCGELETRFPSNNGGYEVRTLINGASLEDCSIVRSNDKIRPYFVGSVVNDPDLIGMLVYLQNSRGEIIGEKIRYILEAYADETALTEMEMREIREQEESNEEQTDTTDKETTVLEENDDDEEENDDDETDPQRWMTWGLPQNGAAREKRSLTDTKVEVKTPAAEIAVRSLADDLPYFPLPNDLEIGSYTLVFEALGKRETLSRTETNVFYLGSAEFNLKDISVYLSGLSNSQLISPKTTVMLEARLDFDSRLDPYVVWYNGRNIISEGKINDGAGNILWTAPEQVGFYSLRLEVFPFRLSRNFTGLSSEITLPVSPKALSLGYFFENDSKFTDRSPLAAGTVYPEQVQLITALLASMEDDSDDADDAEIKEPPVMPAPPELIRWYQFEGNLHDSMSALTNEQSLVSVGEKPPRWAAAGQSYGLSIEPDDAYLLSPVDFFRNEPDQGGGIFLLHIKPPADGAILSVFFPLQSSSSDGAWMDIVKENNTIVLRISAGISAVEMPVYLADSDSTSLIPIVVEFYIRPYRLEAKISMGGLFPQNQIDSISLSDALSGRGIIRLSEVIEKSRVENIAALQITTRELAALTPALPEFPFEAEEAAIYDDDEISVLTGQNADVPPDAETSTSETISPSAIWDELAILLSSVPLLEEAIFEETIIEEQDAAETTIADHKPANESTDNKPAEPVPAALQPVILTPAASGPIIPDSPASLQEEVPAPDSLIESDSAAVDDTETGEAEKSENLILPVLDTDMGDSIQEGEDTLPVSDQTMI